MPESSGNRQVAVVPLPAGLRVPSALSPADMVSRLTTVSGTVVAVGGHERVLIVKVNRAHRRAKIFFSATGNPLMEVLRLQVDAAPEGAVATGEFVLPSSTKAMLWTLTVAVAAVPVVGALYGIADGGSAGLAVVGALIFAVIGGAGLAALRLVISHVLIRERRWRAATVSVLKAALGTREGPASDERR